MADHNKIDLGGRNAVVTGGAQGIGRAIVERFLDSGAAVAIWDRDLALAQKTAAELQGRGTVAAFAADVTKYADVERARDETLKAFGRIDILVNNAGIAGPNMKTWDYPVDAWRQVLIDQSRRAVPLLPGDRAGNDRAELRPHRQHRLDRRQGRQPERAGLFRVEGRRHRADQIARQGAAAHDISVNCITPAAAPTAIFDQMTQEHIDFMLSKIPRGRFVTVEEIAALAAFCASSRVLVHDRRGVRHFRRAGDLLNSSAFRSARRSTVARPELFRIPAAAPKRFCGRRHR